MKNKTTKIILFSYIILILSIWIFGLLIQKYDVNNIIRTDDINLYVNDDYEKLSDNDIYKRTSTNCKKYIPKFDSFEYKNNVIGFYVFNGTKTLTHTSISFVVELQFQNINEYEQFISYEYSRCDYDFNTSVNHNGYECYITESQAFTYYYFEEDVPFQFGMLCVNHEKLNVRYIYFRETEASVNEQFDIVFQNTNCDW